MKKLFVRRTTPPKVTLLDGKDAKALKLVTYGVKSPTKVKVAALVELELTLDDITGLTADDSERQWTGQVLSVTRVLPGLLKDFMPKGAGPRKPVKRKKMRKKPHKSRTKRRSLRSARRRKR